MSYVELHCHSNFSLLDGASFPEALITQAAALEMPALALTSHLSPITTLCTEQSALFARHN